MFVSLCGFEFTFGSDAPAYTSVAFDLRRLSGHREETSLVCPLFKIFIFIFMFLSDGSVIEASWRSVCAEVANLLAYEQFYMGFKEDVK